MQDVLRSLLVGLVLLFAPGAIAAENANPLLTVDTASPQATMRTFRTLTDALETAFVTLRAAPTADQQAKVEQLMTKFISLLDLTQVPPTARREIGGDTVVFLVDVLRRIDVPELNAIPDATVFADLEKPANWSVPGSEITIARIMEGPKKGKFAFDADTVARSGEFHALTKDLPLRVPAYVPSWREAQVHSHGWMIPVGIVRNMPDPLKSTIFETPLWKVLATLLTVTLIAALYVGWHRVIRPEPEGFGPGSYLRRLLMPLGLVAAIIATRFILNSQINLIGSFAEAVEYVLVIALYVAAAWAAWYLVFVIIEWIIAAPTIPDQSLDANLLRLLGRVFGILFAACVAAYGAHQLGVPVLGVIAGLGVGGLAVALAAQSSIENLIGGVNLYLDRPVCVGDFCEYAGIKGHVEHIGLRSTRIRSLDRTVTSVPNSELAKFHVTNYSKRDQMLYQHVIDLRYETTTRQLRELTVGIRDDLGSHPNVRKDIAVPRVHIIGFGDWSIKVEIYAYLDTCSIPEFMALQEQLTLQVIERVDRVGAAFAFPSQTSYLARDSRLPQILAPLSDIA